MTRRQILEGIKKKLEPMFVMYPGDINILTELINRTLAFPYDIEEEQMSDIFTKYHLRGLPFNAVLHKFTEPDKGFPHDHPFAFTSFILKGSYVERVYERSDDLLHRTIKRPYTAIDNLYRTGTVHCVEANHIHQIVELPEGECWTIILPEPKVRESGFWDFRENGKVYFRQWNGNWERQ